MARRAVHAKRGILMPDETQPPVSMAAIAKAAGVHQTTVSLAIRNHPSVAELTRIKILQAAADLGYARDPMLDALIEHRRNCARHRKNPLNIAYVTDHATATKALPGNFIAARLAGAQEIAPQRGMIVEKFTLGENGLSAKRLDGILLHRGISAMIIAGLSPETAQLEMNVGRMSVVKIESLHLRIKCDTITTDHRYATRLAVQNLRKLGYRRIGLAVAKEFESQQQERQTTGYIIENTAIPSEDRIPIFSFDGTTGSLGLKGISNWVKNFQVEAVISNWLSIPSVLRSEGILVPEDVAFAALDLYSIESPLAGICQMHKTVGRLSLEKIDIMVQSNLTGLIDYPSITYVPGCWVDGPSAPPKRPL